LLQYKLYIDTLKWANCRQFTANVLLTYLLTYS